MALSPGTRLGPYEIVAPVGAGGMGEVYKARDTRLDRSVAIKVLPPEVSADADRRARFEREAKTVAGLNHPHICTLHDVGESDGTTYLVMELLAGETLADRLEKGPLPLEQALGVATEIADALAAAHRQGVTHRDLKPANVMLTKGGAVRQGSPQAKLLDFGLAKLTGHGERPAAASLASAATEARPLTSEGMIVGTLQYMAPEQVEGKPADPRTDLWALGAILYEMLTGQRAFEGASAASLITAIMSAEPRALATLQPLTPSALDRVVTTCLAKDPDGRWQSASDVARELRWLRETGGGGAAADARPRRRTARRIVLAATGGVLLVAAGSGLTWLLRTSPANVVPAYLSLDVRPADEMSDWDGATWGHTPGGSRTAFGWTPDGQTLVFVGRRDGVQQIYVRRLDAKEARPIPGTEGALVPAVSPDGRLIGFWANGSVKTVSIDGANVTAVAPDVRGMPYGLAWDDTGAIYFGAADGRIWVAPPGEKPRAVTSLNTVERQHTLPALLPDARALLYTSRKALKTWGTEEVVAQPLPTGERRVVLTNATDARYVPQTGHLLFLRQGNLWAVPFDVGRLETRGREVQVLDGVVQALTAGDGNHLTGAGQYAVSSNGTLAWLHGQPLPLQERTLVTVDRRGNTAPVSAVPKATWGFIVRVSPVGGQVASVLRTLQAHGLWVYELARGTPRQLIRDGEPENASWSPDGQRLVFEWLKDGRRVLGTHRADGSREPGILAEGFTPSTWVDERTIVGVRGGEIVIAKVSNDGVSVQSPWPTPEIEQSAFVSPDGKCLAYDSNLEGRRQVYVRPYPGPGKPEKVSSSYQAGGAAWHPNGRELFFLSADSDEYEFRMMAVSFTSTSPPRFGSPRELFRVPRGVFFWCVPNRCYDVDADGRFYAMQTPPSEDKAPPPVTHIQLVQNWFEVLRTKAPIK